MLSGSTSQAMFLLMTSVVVLMMTSETKAWSQWMDNDVDSWTLRSPLRKCSRTDELCSKSGRCCNPSDICLRSPKRAGRGYCTRMSSLRAQAAKPAREPCVSSQECADGCCREYRKHRVGKVYVCGTPYNEFTTFRCA